MRAPPRPLLIAPVLALLAWGCSGASETTRDLRERRAVLQREVAGLRRLLAARQRGEPLVPVGDVAIVVEDTLVRELIAAQLPCEVDVGRYHLRLDTAEVLFRGNPLVRLRGRLALRRRPELAAALNVLGALEDVVIAPASRVLHARIVVDQLDVEPSAGLATVLDRAALDQLTETIRPRLLGRLPTLEVPVRMQQRLDFPALTSGPVRVSGASLPVEIAVSSVVAGHGRLWIGVHVRPGVVVKAGPKDDASREPEP